MLPYERFEAWQRCHELVLEIYTVTKTFPKEEKLAVQLLPMSKEAWRGAYRRGKPVQRSFVGLTTD